MDSRREFLKKAALLTGAAGMANTLPASVAKAMGINPAPGSTYLDAEHVVILMQENRSFDHVFGTLRGVRGYNDPRAIDLPDKNPVWLQSNEAGQTYAPFHLDIKNTKATWMGSLPHAWDNQVDARNDGKHNGWLKSKVSGEDEYKHMPLTLGYHKREDIPFYYALADAFTICDQNFCSALTGTGPNRLYFWTGTIRAEQDENSRPCVWNDDSNYPTLVTWPTFPERLEDNGISWKCYQNELSVDMGLTDEENDWLSNFTDNPLEVFTQYNSWLATKHVQHIEKLAAELPKKTADLQKKLDALPAGDHKAAHIKMELKQANQDLADTNTELARIKARSFEELSERDKNLHRKAFDVNHADPDYHNLTPFTYDDNGIKRELNIPKGDILYQFRDDVDSGKLPTVSWLVPPANFSDHPGSPWYGAWYVSEVLDILTKNPEVWKKTIFILAYDENDGYFDHVPPFVAPHSHKQGTGKVSDGIDTRVEFVTLAQELERKGFPEEYDRENAIGLGFRVPLIIASPWSRGGYVNSEVFDHTSTLQFLEDFLTKKTGKKITETNISEWRRTICGDLTSVFRPWHGEKIEWPVFLEKDAYVEGIHKAKFKKLPADYKQLATDDIAQIKRDRWSSPLMPVQEKGIKPSAAINYQLYTDGKLSADKKAFEIKFNAANVVFGDKALGAPFNIYAPGKYLNDQQVMEDVRTWSYAVKPGDTLIDAWPLQAFENSHYHLRVYGPNGFFREFAGNIADPEIDILCDYQTGFTAKQLTGNIALKLANKSGRAHQIQIIDNAYKTNNHTKILSAGSSDTLVLNLEKSHNWYDFTVKVSGSDFTRRYAGHVDTGKHSYSDPQMGGTVA